MDIRYMMLKDRYYFVHTNMVLISDDKKMAAFKREISLFIKELSIFDISLSKLSCIPPNKNIQNELLNIAVICSENEVFSDFIRFNSELPIKKLISFTKKGRTFFEKWQDYILFYYLLLSNEQYSNLLSFLNIHRRQDTLTRAAHDKSSDEELNGSEAVQETFGLVLECGKKKCYVLTTFGYIKVIKNTGNINYGEISTSKPEIGKKEFKLPIRFLLLYLIIFVVAISYIYTIPEKDIVIKSNFLFELSVNRWGKVTSVKPLNEAADKIKYKCSTFNMNYDEATLNLLETAEYLKYIKKNSEIEIYFKSKNNSKPDFKQTINYLKTSNLDSTINNNGKLFFEK